ncbi:MAG TPA: phosphoserine phosphatase SerB, partial [Geminicoccaceae bacterium]|nr:phosphoserine phosphatase SerB [Geminicoccaceae bacterium]
AAARVRAAVGAGVDVAGLPASGDRRKRLLVCDMDSTVITVECIDELADYVGLKAEVAAITRRAMNGEIDFAPALRERVALLAGLPAATLEEVYRERVRPMPGALTCVRTMRRMGARTALVSGGFGFFTRRVARDVGFDVEEANELEVRDGRLTGRVLEPVRGREAKLAALRRFAAEDGLTPRDALAAGDGANDLPMLRAAGLGVAFRAHPRVAARAAVSIAHGDLTALLYLQGIPEAEFVTPAA